MTKLASFTYVTNKGSRFVVKMDDASVLEGIRGTAATGALTENLTVKLSKNKNAAGIQPRHILFARTIGVENPLTIGLTDTGKRYRTVVCMTQDAWDDVDTDAASTTRTTFIQNGATYYAVRKVNEVIK